MLHENKAYQGFYVWWANLVTWYIHEEKATETKLINQYKSFTPIIF
jgi:hypothetical protein